MRLLAIATITITIQAQGWAARQDGSSSDRIRAVTTDHQGNVYVTGYSLSPTIVAYDASGFNVTSRQVSGTAGAFLIKYDSSGQVIWMAMQDGNLDEYPRRLATDSVGNVFVCGAYFSIPLLVYDANGVVSKALPNSGSQSSYVVKYASNGSVLWAARQDSILDDQAYIVSTNSQDELYVGGYYYPVLGVYDAQGVNVKNLTSGASSASYLVKYASNGSFIWALKLDGSTSSFSSIQGSTVDQQNDVLLTGDFANTGLDLYDVRGSYVKTLSLTGSGASFVIKFKSNGSFVWAAKQNGAGQATGNQVAASSSQVYVAGYFSSQLLVYDAQDNIVKSISSSGTSAAFLVTYLYNGSFVWAARQDSSGQDWNFGCFVDIKGDVLVSGYYQSLFSVYDLYDVPVKSLPLSGTYGAFVVKYFSNVSVVWTARQDGPGTDQSYGVTCDKFSNVYVAGYYSSSLLVYDAFGQLGGAALPGSGSQSGYVVKYDQNGLWNFTTSAAFVPITTTLTTSGSTGYQSQSTLAASSSVTTPSTSASSRSSQTATITTNVVSVQTSATTVYSSSTLYGSTSSLAVLSLQTTLSWSSSTRTYSQTSTTLTSKATLVSVTGTLALTTSVTVQASSSLVHKVSSNSLVTSSSLASTISPVLSSTVMNISAPSLILSALEFTSTIMKSNSIDDQVKLYYSQQDGAFASSTSSPQDLKAIQQLVPTDLLSLFILLTAVMLLVCLCLLMLMCCIRRRRKSKFIDTAESQNTTMTGQTSNMATTMMVTSHVLAVPQFLVLQFGVDVRQLEQIARGGGGSINHCQVLDASKVLNYDQSKLVIKNFGKDVGYLQDRLRQSFYQEVSMLHMFRDQPFFAKMFGFTEQPATIVLKYYELGSLMQFIMGKGGLASRFRYSKRQVLSLQVKLGHGLAVMHAKSFAHCDIKPDNVLLERVGSLLEPRITDFGISRLLDKSASQVHAFELSQICGASMRYAAPEVIERFRRHLASDPETWKAGDTYALSIVCYEMLTRREVWPLGVKE